MPTQSPSSVLPVLSSSRTGVHSPERSTPRAAVLTSSSWARPRRPPAPTTVAASTPARIDAREMRCMLTLLEHILHAELQNARIAGGENLTERRARQVGDRRKLLGAAVGANEVVRHVERLEPELDILRA